MNSKRSYAHLSIICKNTVMYISAYFLIFLPDKDTTRNYYFSRLKKKKKSETRVH